MKRPRPGRTEKQRLQLYSCALGALILRLGGEVTLTDDEIAAVDTVADRPVIGGHEFRAWMGAEGEA